MKKYLFFIATIVLQSNNFTNAQNLVIQNKLWSITEYGSEGGGSYHSSYIKFSGDTVINEINYKNIFKSEDSLYQNWQIHGQIREDDSGRVYNYNSSSHSEELLYDFSVITGDSLLSPFGYVYIDSVKFKHFGSSDNLYKFIYLKPFEIWIEGVGSLRGILNGIQNIDLIGIYHDLVCYSENDVLIYRNEQFSSCFPQGQVTHIDTNPVHDNQCIINVITNYPDMELKFNKLNTSNASVMLYDVNGRLISHTFLHGETQLNISIEQYKPGIYFYLFQNRSEFLSGKFVVIHD